MHAIPIVRKLSIKSELAKNVFTLFTGTSIAQTIPLITSPILTRLYTPEAFGVFSLYVTLVSILVFVATGRYDLALMLPKKDENAINVLGFSVFLVLNTSLVLWIIIIFFNRQITNLFKTPEISIWLYFLPLSILFFGLFHILGSWLNRQKKYVALASSNVTMKIGAESAKVGLGLSQKIKTIFSNGLVVGSIFGQILSSTILILHFIKHEHRRFKFINLKKMINHAKLYRKFPTYNVPFSLISAFYQGFLIISFTSFGHLEAAGYFGFVKAGMLLPITFLSTSLGRVFFKEATTHFSTPRLEDIAVKLFTGIVRFLTPAFIFFIFWAPDIFKYVFGQNWLEAGIYASIFAPVAYLFLFTSWPERVFEVAQKQQIPFFLQLISTIFIVLFVTGALSWKANPVSCVWIFTLVSVIYHSIYLFAVFKVANFAMSTLISLFVKIIKIVIFLSAALMLCKLVIPESLIQFVVSFVILIAYYTKLIFSSVK